MENGIAYKRIPTPPKLNKEDQLERHHVGVGGGGSARVKKIKETTKREPVKGGNNDSYWGVFQWGVLKLG